MTSNLFDRAWWLVLMCVSSSLGVAGQCAYNTTKCTCASGLIVCVGLTAPPELVKGLNDGKWTEIDFHDGDLKSLPAFPPGIQSVSFFNVPLIQLSDLDASATYFNKLSINDASFKILPEAFQKLQNLTELFIMDTPLEDWDNKTLVHLGSSLTTLHLEKIAMNQWPPGFSLLNNLKELLVNDLAIASIPEDAFSNMSDSLATLQLSNLGITSIPSSLFALRNLTSLTLSDNNLADGQSVFDLMSSSPLTDTLTTLYVASMGLTRIPDLSNFTSLTEVTFQSNTISKIDIDSLPSSLTRFGCSNCSLSSIPSQIQRLSNLTRLILSFNQIQTVNLDSIPATVTTLSLDNNNITEITCLDKNMAASLNTLNLQKNMLSAIPECIQNLSRLSKLYLWNNDISELNFDSFPPNLTYLVLSNNKISKILPSNSTTPSLLDYIMLSHNPLNNIDPSAFVNLINLKTLRLDNTNLTRLPLALASLPALTDLLITSNQIVTCQCPADTGLVQWFKSRSGRLSIGGSCQPSIDIQDYLSGYCDLLTSTVTEVSVIQTTPHNSRGALTRSFVSPWFVLIFTLLMYRSTLTLFYW